LKEQGSDRQSVNNKLTAASLFAGTIDPDLDGNNLQATYAGYGDVIAARNFLSLYATSVKAPTQPETTAYIKAYIADPGDAIINAVGAFKRKKTPQEAREERKSRAANNFLCIGKQTFA
jgi:hypothetical protein